MLLGHFTSMLFHFSWRVFPSVKNCLILLGSLGFFIGFFCRIPLTTQYLFSFSDMKSSCDSLLILGLLHPQVWNLMLTEKWKWSHSAPFCHDPESVFYRLACVNWEGCSMERKEFLHTFPWNNFSRMNYLEVCLVLLNLLWYLSRVFIFVLCVYFFSRFLVHLNWMVVNSYYSLSGSLHGVGSHWSIIIEEGVAYPLLMSSRVFGVGNSALKHILCLVMSSVKLHEVRLMTKGLKNWSSTRVDPHPQAAPAWPLHSTVPEGPLHIDYVTSGQNVYRGCDWFLSCAGFPLRRS